ncbi:MAG: hypothetical protein LC754_07520 [Acidobacteria bacterium]|nr:hypothetical protein [Acidobacteriota bacterium]
MNSSNTFTFGARARLCALVAVFLLAAGVAPVRAQHQGHDMQNMPGMNTPKPKPTPTPQKKKQTAKPQPDDAGHVHGMDMSKPAPSPSPSPSPTASPEQMENMPGMQMPAGSPSTSPQASPSPEHKMDMPGMKHEGHDSMPGMSGMKMGGMHSMNMGPLMVMTDDDMGIRIGSSESHYMPMGAMGSGTTWQPASSPMHMLHKVAGDWLLMLHGEAKLGVNSQGGPRGVTKFESMNWIMPMAFHKLGRGTLQLRGMFSLEPLTLAPGGTPELFQTGETYKGQPLVDKQHPHDLFMELSAQYTMAMGEHGSFFTYFGFPGEPALGPVAFMHRMSASENPTAPLSHHLQDSTHVSFGVLTSGFTYRKFKLEGSLFNGQEPGENRYNFEFHPFSSRSARLSFAPTRNWALQISHGFLRNPEALERGVTRRTTASVQYNKPFNRGNWATGLIWGRNFEHHDDGDIFRLNGYTAESTVNFLDKNYLYTRLELVDKNELLRDADRVRLGIADDHPSFRIGAYTFGYVRDLVRNDKYSMGLGGDTTFYSKPAALDLIYGSNPVSYKLFLRFRLGGAMGGSNDMHDMHGGMQMPQGQQQQQ